MQALRILVADDSPSQLQWLAAQLRELGHEVCAVNSGETAILAYTDFRPELVLMDLEMPGLGGLEAVRQLRRIPGPHWVPIIIITASQDDGDILTAFMAGADDYLTKPIDPLKLDVRIMALRRIAMLQRTTAAVIDHMLDGVVQIDRVGRITAFNLAAERIFGYRASEVLGCNVAVLMPSPDRERHDQYLADYAATGEQHIIGVGRKVLGQRKDGSTFPMQLGVTEAATPEERFFIGLIRDLSAEEALREQIDYQAHFDNLTALPNRHSAWKHLQARYATPGEAPAECTLFFCDLDHFKAVNDQHGHLAGDVVLQQVGQRLREALFVRDFLGRFGGDEFIVVVDGNLDDRYATSIAERLIDTLRSPIETDYGPLSLGLSVGIAHARDWPDVKTLLHAADGAMYQAKRGGPNRSGLAHVSGAR